MEASFISPPAKRTIHNLQGMNHPNPSFSNGVAGGGAAKRGRSKPPPPPLSVLPGHAAFRLLCHSSRVGGVIGKSGTIVKQLQVDTGAKIRVEESPPGSDERVIVVIGSSSVDKKVSLDGGGEEVFEVSTAQEAVFRVFERILDVAAVVNGSGGPGGVVSCRLLAEAGQAGSVIGKGGKVVEQIRKVSGCKIRVLSSEKMPACAYPNDEMIEIEGEILGVKKALLSVSRRLQDCPPGDKPPKISGSRPFEAAVPYETLPDPRDHFPPRSFGQLPPIPSSSVSYASGGRTLSQQDVVFKILCSNDRVGGVIGKSGTIVRALQNETGASISVGASIPECDERLITVTASENLESKYSPAQNAAILVFTRSVEAGFEKRLESSTDGSPVSARLVVPSNQVGCLLGKGGAVISEMRKVTGAGIKILGSDQVPKCASERDSVVQISGEFPNVQDAVYHVTGKLRDNLSPNKPMNGTGTWIGSAAVSEIGSYGRAGDPSLGLHPSYGASPGLNRHNALTQSMDHLGLSHNLDRPLSPRSWASQTILNPRSVMDGRGLTSFKGGLELGSGSKSAIVTNATVEIVVPENVMGSVYGENGSNLTRLRQISGAKVVVHEPRPGTSERTVVISGTPDETQAAQSLLQAFILTGSS